MIKAVFFDLYNTLVGFDPERGELQARICREFGLDVDPQAVRRGYPLADDFWSRENARLPVAQRPEAERQAFYAEYERIILAQAGVQVSPELAGRIFARLRQVGARFTLYPDVLPALNDLKARGLTLGLVSNIRREMDGLVADLGLAPYLDFLLSSQEAGAEKPHPPIFLAALRLAGVAPSEALHVGDQYHSDVIGARGVGIQPILIDRDDAWPEIADCPRIRSLMELVHYLE